MAEASTERSSSAAATSEGGGFGSGMMVGLLVIVVVVALLLFFGFSGRGNPAADTGGSDTGVPSEVDVNLEGAAGVVPGGGGAGGTGGAPDGE
jgi:predicted metalloprotease